MTLLWTVSLKHVMIVNNKNDSFMKGKAFHESWCEGTDHPFDPYLECLWKALYKEAGTR